MELAGTALIVVLVVVAVIAVAVVGSIYAKVRFKIATPDEALIITGRKSGKPVINRRRATRPPTCPASGS